MNNLKREGEYANPWGDGSPGQIGSDRKRKKKSRWGGDEKEKTFIPGMPTVIPVGLSKDQEEQYLVQLQIEEISRRLRTGDLGIPANPDERSPSPEPIYNSEGKRLNTREYRTRKKLEEERHQHIQTLLKMNPEYKPPADYKPPVIRVNDKVMIPQEEHPDINFVGLLIGPRGNTLKNLEKETGAKIIIRGKGSVKEGKIGRKDGQPLPGEDEPLHAYVTANNPENVRKAVDKIKEIIKQGIEVPEGQNDLRRQQLRELALLNGTLRENDGLAKLKQLQQAQSIITNTILCSVCGGTGHIAADCKQKRPGDSFRNAIPPQSAADKAKMDSEYMSLMAELGEGPPPAKNNGQPAPPNITSRPHFALSDGSSPTPLALPPPSQPRPPFPGPPPMGSAPWQQPPMGPNANKPPNLMGLPPNQPITSQPSAPISLPSSQPPPMGLPVSCSGPVPTSGMAAVPPWQQVSSGPPTTCTTSVANVGMPPPSNLLPPPPPPPSSQPPAFPWQQQHQQQQMPGMVPPPPPPAVSGVTPPWQQGNVPLAPVPPPPPIPAGALSRWNQPGMGPPPAPAPVAPPPPPPAGQSGFNPSAPPPPPPGSEHLGMNLPGIPLGVPPPPPPK